MDKETLSNYGWIVICVLVLAVMLALATPFGTFVSDAVKSTTQGLFDVNQSALNSTGLITVEDQEFDVPNMNNGTTNTVVLAPGLYEAGTTQVKYTWDELINGGTMTISGGKLSWEDNDEAPRLNGDLVLPTDGTVTDITEAFDSCSGLTGITIGAGVTKIGASAFEDCEKLSSVTFTVDCQVSSIEADAFYNCDSLTNITIPASVVRIGRMAFDGCDNLVKVEFGKNSKLEVIDEEAFYGCEKLQSINIPGSVTSIGSYAFDGCIGLEAVTFDNNSKLEVIDDCAFQTCTKLSSIELPQSVTHIGEDAFYDCTNLSTIKFNGTTTQWNSITFGNENWNYDVPATQVQCSDGTISLS